MIYCGKKSDLYNYNRVYLPKDIIVEFRNDGSNRTVRLKTGKENYSDAYPRLPYVTCGCENKNKYYYYSDLAKDKWVIEHNLKGRPIIQLYNSKDELINGEIHYLDLDRVEVIFSEPVAGYAICLLVKNRSFYYEGEGSVWDIEHNLDEKPFTEVFNSQGYMINAEVKHLDENHTRISFFSDNIVFNISIDGVGFEKINEEYVKYIDEETQSFVVKASTPDDNVTLTLGGQIGKQVQTTINVGLRTDSALEVRQTFFIKVTKGSYSQYVNFTLIRNAAKLKQKVNDSISVPIPYSVKGYAIMIVDPTASYVHKQIESVTEWNIKHNFGEKCLIQLIDPDLYVKLTEIKQVNNNEIKVVFSEPTSGEAVCIACTNSTNSSQGGVMVVNQYDLPDVATARLNTIYVLKPTGFAYITNDNFQWIAINVGPSRVDGNEFSETNYNTVNGNRQNDKEIIIDETNLE